MSVIHFLNVKNGDCSAIKHNSGHVTVIDVCNATKESEEEPQLAQLQKIEAREDLGIPGNFNQKQYPVNPVSYLNERGIKSVFRFILTHPDMDHMDGLECFFNQFDPINFWDTDNQRNIEFHEGSGYNEEDWKFYTSLRDKPRDNSEPKRLTLLSGEEGKYWNLNENGDDGGDGLHILAPTKKLVDDAKTRDEYNDCSYVILFKTHGHSIIFAGDSHDKTWEHVLSNHREKVKDIHLLIAPHHGRESNRNFEFLDVLNPKMTFFGNADAEHLAYSAWKSRGLKFITTNQANCMVVDCSDMSLYVTHEHYAKKRNSETYYYKEFQAYWVGKIQ